MTKDQAADVIQNLMEAVRDCAVVEAKGHLGTCRGLTLAKAEAATDRAIRAIWIALAGEAMADGVDPVEAIYERTQ